jgi:hypothetical protein
MDILNAPAVLLSFKVLALLFWKADCGLGAIDLLL